MKMNGPENKILSFLSWFVILSARCF